ncbi:MAG: SpoIIE family protein phosphatase [Planctomycetes bacterium]|nr:SpoIIE family protein phosphatase [Planctomycetota bacterium]
MAVPPPRRPVSKSGSKSDGKLRPVSRPVEEQDEEAPRPSSMRPAVASSARNKAVSKVGVSASSKPASQRKGRTASSEGDGVVVKIPMGIKFAVAIAGTVAICCSIFAFIAYSTTKTQVVNELDRAGVRLIKVLSAFDMNLWNAYYEGTGTSKETTERYNEYIQKFDDLISGKVEKDAPSDNVKIALELSKKEFAAFRDLKLAFSNDPLRRLAPSANDAGSIAVPEIINIAVSKSTDDNRIVSCIRPESVALGSPVAVGEIDGTTIFEGYYKGDVLARSYTRKIKDQYGKEVGRIDLYLTAETLDEVSRSVFIALLIPWFFALAIGGGIGYFLATLVTKPIGQLLGDINVVSRGDLDHETMPHSKDEIGLLADTFNRMTQSVRSAHMLELDRRALEHELVIANDIQANLLPKKLPRIAGYDVAAYYRPTKEIGGDYYDFIQIDSQRLGIVIADVSGKGIPGSMVMTMARGLIRMEATKNLSTADTLAKVNKIIAGDIKPGMFVTALYAIWNVAEHKLLVSSAGHNPLIVVRKRTGKVELINPNGIALGFDKGPIFQRTVKESVINIEPGDRFVFYTDGVPEAMNAEDELFGEERFHKLCVALADKESNGFVSAIVNAIDDHKGDAPQHDDITLVTLRLLPR